VYCFNLLTFHLLVPEKVWILGYLNQNSVTYESNGAVSLKKIYWLLYSVVSTVLFFSSRKKKADLNFLRERIFGVEWVC
jgi:hypothetical protein